MIPNLYAVTCENGSMFVFAGDKGIFTNRAHADQVAKTADGQGRKACHCKEHRVVTYKPQEERFINVNGRTR